MASILDPRLMSLNFVAKTALTFSGPHVMIRD
jgi:hypothetical protein